MRIITLAVILLLTSCSKAPEPEPTPTPPPAVSKWIGPGYVGTLHALGGAVPVAVSREALVRFTELAVANDTTGMEQMRAEDLVAPVKSGTRCKVVSEGLLTYEVRPIGRDGTPLPITVHISRDMIE